MDKHTVHGVIFEIAGLYHPLHFLGDGGGIFLYLGSDILKGFPLPEALLNYDPV